jgi:hypothetical protein
MATKYVDLGLLYHIAVLLLFILKIYAFCIAHPIKTSMVATQ